MVQAIAYVISPTHAISLEAALTTLFPGRHVHCDVIVAWPGLPEVRLELVEVLTGMFAESSHKFRFWSDPGELNGMESKSHFFFAHDVVGDVVHRVCQAVPTAIRVCIGDALGMVCDRDYHLGLILNGKKPNRRTMVYARLNRQIRRFFDRRKIIQNRSIVPDLACLILPVDQTGNSLLGVKIIVPKLSVIRALLARMAKSFPDLHEFTERVRQSSMAGRTSVLLIENIAESGSMNLDQEIAMYAAMIRTCAPRGTLVVVKSHPGEKFDRMPLLRSELGDDYTLMSAPMSLKRVPIEIWSELLAFADVISLSYPTLSLAYLLDKEVKNPIDNVFIEKWFASSLWDSYRDAHKLYEVPRKNLRTWSGTGLLARGPF